jgi:hypothetical protein
MQGPWLLSQWEGKWTAGQHYGWRIKKTKIAENRADRDSPVTDATSQGTGWEPDPRHWFHAAATASETEW